MVGLEKLQGSLVYLGSVVAVRRLPAFFSRHMHDSSYSCTFPFFWYSNKLNFYVLLC